MRIILFTLITLLFTSVLPAQHYQIPTTLNPSDYNQGKVIFKVRPEFTGACRQSAIELETFNKALNLIPVASVSKKFPRHTAPALERNSRGEKMVDISTIYELHFST